MCVCVCVCVCMCVCIHVCVFITVTLHVLYLLFSVPGEYPAYAGDGRGGNYSLNY